jgi:hypothetical protein
MNLPDKELYTPEELADKWGTTVDKIDQQVKAGKLKRCGKLRMADVPILGLPYEMNGPALELFYRREDVERFEKERERTTIKANEPVRKPTETEKQLVDRLKLEGQTEKDIAKELKRVFPEIKNSRIGRLLPANPGSNISNDGHRKQGERLLQ